MRSVILIALCLFIPGLSACEPVEDAPGDVADTSSADTAETLDTAPAGPVIVIPERTSVGFELRNNSQGTPEYHAELCMTGSMFRDPRDGLTLSRGKTCIDSLVLRFFVARTGNTAEAGGAPPSTT